MTTPLPELLLESFSPELLTKYGLAADALNEAQFKAIQDVATLFKPNRQGLVLRGLARVVAADPVQIGAILLAAQQLQGLIQFGFDASELIGKVADADLLITAANTYQAKFEGKAASKAGEEFGVNDTTPDWTDGRYRVYIAKNEHDCIRYGQNQRYGFCISRRNDNYYHDYRAKFNASYYFVYDTALSAYDAKHITVISARSDGSYEFTFANNAQDHNTRKFNGNLDAFLATKPGLEKARAMFVCNPLSGEEETQISAARGAEGEGFSELTAEQQLTYVRLGRLLSDEQYKQAPLAVRDAYIARAHMLTDAQAAVSTENQRRRAAQLYHRYNKVDKAKPAAWLAQYPAAEAPQGVVAQSTMWPPTSDAVEGWFGKAKATQLSESAGQSVANGYWFPLGELLWDPLTILSEGADYGAVTVLRLDEGFQVLTGLAHVRQAQAAGQLEVAAQLVDKNFANLLLREANVLLPTALIQAGVPSRQQAHLVEQLRQHRPLPIETLAQLSEQVQAYYYEQCPRYGVQVPLSYLIHRGTQLARVV